MLCVQESALDSVVARLRLRMAGMKCVGLAADADRVLVEAAVQEAQQQGATVSRKIRAATLKMSDSAHNPLTLHCVQTGGSALTRELNISTGHSYRRQLNGSTLQKNSLFFSSCAIPCYTTDLALEKCMRPTPNTSR